MRQDTKPNDTIDSLTSIEFERARFEALISSFLSMLKMAVQGITVVSLANISLIGFAINNELAGLLFLGGFVPIIATFLLYLGDLHMLPIIFTAMNIEAKHSEDRSYGVSAALISAVIPVSFTKLKSVATITGVDEQMSELKKIANPFKNKAKYRIIIALIFLSLSQCIVAALLNQFYEWKLF